MIRFEVFCWYKNWQFLYNCVFQNLNNAFLCYDASGQMVKGSLGKLVKTVSVIY